MTEISGNKLTDLKWDRNGSRYTKGTHVINYDGTDWTLDKKRIKCMEDIPEELKQTAISFNPKTPNDPKL